MPQKLSLSQPPMELGKLGSVHGRVVFKWGESPYCMTYCKYHVDYVLSHGMDIIPDHNKDNCAGVACCHNGDPFKILKITRSKME